MKIHRTVCLAAAIVIPQLVLATLPMSKDTFGTIEGTLDYCAQVDSRTAPKYQERKKGMVQGVSEKELAEARDTKEYKEAYEKTSTEFSKVVKDKAMAACKAYLEGK